MTKADLTIILRTCLGVDCFSGGDRLAGMSKRTVVGMCIASLKESIIAADRYNKNINFILVDDHSKDIEFVHTEISPYVNEFTQIDLETTGNGESLKKVFELACDPEIDGLVYIVEDDYIHDPRCITKIIDDYKVLKEQIGHEVVIHPVDYPDRYDRLYTSFVLLGTDRHYRTIKHTTCTLAAHTNTFIKHRELFMGMTEYGVKPGVSEDTTINKVYDLTPCLSPLPSLAVHLQYKSTLSPYIHWDDWVPKVKA